MVSSIEHTDTSMPPGQTRPAATSNPHRPSSTSPWKEAAMGSQIDTNDISVAARALDQKLSELFQRIEADIQKTKMGEARWYIVAMACLVAGPDPEAAAQLYLYLCQQPRYKTSATRQELVRRLREVLVKAVSIVGVCKPLEAILAISKVEQPEDKDYTSTREDWQCDDANYQRAMQWYRKVYTKNASDTMGLFDSHKDFAWISANITYGLYLGDRQVLDDLDTEMVVFPAIMAQNLPTETFWHIRGTRRIGVSKEDTQMLWDTIKTIMGYYGIKLDRVPTVDQVEPDV